MKKSILGLMFVLLVFSIYTIPVWDSPTCIRKSVNIDWNGSSAITIDGNIIYVWSAMNSGTRDIYAQKFSFQGQPVWLQPIVICDKPGSQENPQIISTSFDTYIICWDDYSTSSLISGDYSTLSANSINQSGTKLWGQDGITICSNHLTDNNIQLVVDNIGSSYFIWEDRRVGDTYIYGQSVNSSGILQWQADGIPLTTMPSNSCIAINDSEAGFLLGYKYNIDDTQYISVNRYNNAGSAIQEMNVFSQQGTNHVKLESLVKCDNNTLICTWQYSDGTSYNVVAQKIGNNGALLWQTPTVLFTLDDFSNVNEVKCVTTSDNKIAFSWILSHPITHARSIHIQLLASDGLTQWGNLWIDQAIGEKGDNSYQLTRDQNGGLCILWQDTSHSHNICAQHITSEGLSLWGDTGKIVSNHSKYKGLLKAMLLNNLICFTWQDQNNGEQGISTQLYDLDGNAQLEANGKSIIMDICGDIIYESPQIIHRSNDTIIIWNDGRFSEPQQLYFQIVNDDGICLLEENGRKLIADYLPNVTNFTTTLGDNDQVAVAWMQFVNDSTQVCAQLIDAEGNTLWGEQGLQVSGSDYLFQFSPQISYDDGAFYVAWRKLVQQDHRSAVACQKIVNGQKQWGENGIFITDPTIMNIQCSVITISGRYLVMGLYNDNSRFLKAQFISPEGIPEEGWPAFGRIIDDYSNNNINEPDPIIDSNEQGLFISWFSSRTEGKLFAQHISPQGDLLWNSNGTLISTYAGIHQQILDESGITYLWTINDFPEKLMYTKYDFFGSPTIVDTTLINSITSNATFVDFQVCGFLNGGKLVAINKIENEIADITLKYTDPNSIQIGPSTGTILSNPVNYSTRLSIAADQHNAYIAWNEYAYNRFDPLHDTIWNNDVVGLFLQKLSNESVENQDAFINPSMITLAQNYPNPFNPESTIKYSLPQKSIVKLEIYNIKGQKVKTLVNEEQSFGTHAIKWDSKDDTEKSVSSGIYLYRLDACKNTLTKKMVLLK